MKTRAARLLMALVLITGNVPARAAETACATVKMEIQQELTLERQAFDAHMRINNGYTNLTLSNVSVSVLFTDGDGDPVAGTSDPNDLSAKFFVRVDTLSNIADVAGTGAVGPSTAADIHWLIIPAPGAADGNPAGALYFVGAELRYSLGGAEKVMSVTPDHIVVQPMPQLSLDYFLPAQVHGDDAFTPETEAPVPFPLGVRVKNAGFGAARALKIESAQPTIIDNAQGLLIGFDITGCDVNGVSSPLNLLADFGAVAPGRAGVARWTMTSSLSGRFTDFSARMTHADALGGALTSLITGVATHTLIKDVLIDAPGRDRVPDFLAEDGGALRLFDSENADAAVANLSGGASFQPSGNDVYALSTPPSPGFFHARLADPKAGGRPLLRVLRSDGKTIKPDNAWLSRERQGPGGPWLHYFNLFDDGGVPGYTVTYGDPSAANRPPVLQAISDQSGAESQALSFALQASDPEGAPLILSAAALPVGASFTDNGGGAGLFSWTPVTGQAGRYEVVFSASDGALSADARAVIVIGAPDGDLHLTDQPDWITTDTPAWTWSAPAGASPTGYLLRLDDGAEVLTTTTTYTAPPLLDGRHSFSVRARYGSSAGAPQTDDFGVDTRPPTLWSVVLNGGALGASAPAVTVEMTDDGDGLGSGIASREISVDGGPFAPFEGLPVLLPASYGPHTVAARLTDAVGRLSAVVEDGIVFSHALQALTGTSFTGETAVLRDLRTPFESSVPVLNGTFRFEDVPAGLYGLLVRNAAATRAHPSRISLLENRPVDVGAVEPGAQGGSVAGRIAASAEGVPVAAGVNLGQGYFLEAARGVTDALGDYSLPGLAPGPAVVKVLPDPSGGRGPAAGVVEIAGGATVQKDLTPPASTAVGGTADRRDIFLRAAGPAGTLTPFPVDGSGGYAVGLSTGAHALFGVAGYARLDPVAVSISSAPLRLDLSLQTVDVSTTASVSNGSLVLDASADPGVSKALQVCEFQRPPDPAAFPYFIPRSEEIADVSTGTFRLYGADGPLCLLADDAARDIHGANLVPHALTGPHQYDVTGEGSRVEGSVLRSPSNTAVSKPTVLLQDVAGSILGVAEGGDDGGYFFKNAPPNERCALIAVDPATGLTGGAGPLSLAEGGTSSGRNILLWNSPNLAIVTYPASAVGGGQAPVTVTWSGADTAVYDLGLRIVGGGGTVKVEKIFDLPGPSGAGTFLLDIPAVSVPSGNYIYGYINSKSAGWAGRLADARTASNTLSLVPPPTVTIKSYPASVYPGSGAAIKISWVSVDPANYNLDLRIVSGPVTSGPNGSVAEQFFEFPSAAGTQFFTMSLPWTAPLGGAYVYAAINSKSAGWPGRLHETRTADGSVTVKAPLAIKSSPATAFPGSGAAVKMFWAGVDPANYNLGLRIFNGTGTVTEQFHEFPLPQGTTTFVIPIPWTAPLGSAAVYAFINSKAAGWPGRLYEAQTAPGSMTLKAPLAIKGFPATVRAGRTASIKINWTGVDAADYNLGLRLANGTGPVAEKFFEFPSAAGTTTFALPVPATAPPGGAYVYAFINSKATGWSGRLYEARTPDGSVTVTPP